MLTDIRLLDFRTYKDAAFELDDGVNIIVGPNASGKTNLLESILMVGRGGSYRAKTAEQIRFGRPWARVEAHAATEGLRAVKLQHAGPRALKSFDIDGKNYKRLPFGKTLPIVLFEPQHLLLLTGPPELRRDFLDDLLAQTTPSFGMVRQAYRRTLQQRNALLKKNSLAARQQLFAWNVRLSELGGQLALPRHRLATELNAQVTKLYQKLSRSKAKIELTYSAHLPIETYASSLLKRLESDTELDLARGFTGSGPHRDDVEIKLNGRKVPETASRGEIRTILLALKLLELRVIEDIRGLKPLLLLDDVFSELDGARRKALTQHLKDYQTFITTTDADVVVHNFAQKCHIIPVNKNYSSV